ncbi:MAG: O-methyltransferase [Ferruginibacter sp.]
MEIINTIAEQYAEKFTTTETPLLEQINRHTLDTHPHAQMLSGHVQGKLLAMFSRMIRPEKILEIGTFVGYSGIYLTEGLKPEGKLHTIEFRQEDADTAKKNFIQAGVDDKVELHVGDAAQIIPQLKEQWDLVFIDADKVSYIKYYELTLPQVKKRGFIIADNVLFHGEVLTEEIKGKNAKAIHEFNHHIMNDSRTSQVLLTVRDGLLIMQKL